jgi:hypothetical protein
MNFIIIVLFSFLITDPADIAKINKTKEEARKAFNAGNYKTAIEKYKYLIDKLEVDEDAVKMNLASAYYLANDTTNAQTAYRDLTQSENNIIRSNAFQQLGVMNNKKGKAEEALGQFKQAIKADPTNQDARYNYEMLKKKLEDKKKQDEQNKDKNKDQKDKQDKKDDQKKDDKKQDEKDKKDQDKKDQEKKDQEKKDQEKKEQDKKDQEKKDQQDKKDKKDDKKDDQKKDQKPEEDQKNDDKKDKKVPPEVSQKLKEMKISEDKAKMILEAMKNQEAQYLQQNKRKATKPRDKGKPDW